jgi:transcriptional regulator with XRE-family HTH domain
MPLFINSMMKKIWKAMRSKAYRDSYVEAHISNTIASQITKLRMAKGWTQTQLAEHAGMKQSRISALEDPNWTNVEIATLLRIASAFDVALTARFTPFSELAQWTATLSEQRMLVPNYNEEAVEKSDRPMVAEGGAAAAFANMLMGQRSMSSLYSTVANQNAARALTPIIRFHNRELANDSVMASAEAGAMIAARTASPRVA